MISATLDSSVYVRAPHLGGPAAQLIGLARQGDLRIDVSEPILKEALGVLRDKFGWDGYSIQDMHQKLTAFTNRVMPDLVVNVISYDPPDNRILECAVCAKSDFILSEDKDLLRLGAYEGIPIVTIAKFLKIVAGEKA